MKKVLASLLVGVTLCGGLFGCGEETVSKAKYDEVVKANEQLVEDNENLVKDKQELQAEKEEEAKRQEEEAKRQEEERIAQEQEDLQPYRDATAYIQQEANKSGYDFKVYLNEATKTIEISYDTGDTSVSDLREIGYDDEYIKSMGDFESVYSDCQVLAISCYTEAVVNYGVEDIQIKVTMKIGGETICSFNQDGDCVYSIF